MAELERRLEAAAPYAEFPATPDLAGAARARLPDRRPRSQRRLALALALVVAALAGAVLALSPGARSAVVDLLDRIPGLEIERRAELPDVPYRTRPSYGLEVSLEGAKLRFARQLELPRGLGTPDHLYWLPGPPADMVTAVYGDTVRARAVFSQWKVGSPLLYKVLAHGTGIEVATVGPGRPGIWLFGREHAVFFLSQDRNDRAHHFQQGYLAGNVLAWSSGGHVVYRLEARVSKERALEIARSLR
jgi:hypothetical protein